MTKLRALVIVLLATAVPRPTWADEAGDCRNFDVLAKTDPARLFSACRWLAEAGGVIGQYNLGRLYAAGLGVPMDRVRAHMWFSLAAARGIATAAQDRDLVVKAMTAEQIAEASRLAAEWMPKPHR